MLKLVIGDTVWFKKDKLGTLGNRITDIKRIGGRLLVELNYYNWWEYNDLVLC